MSSCKKYGGICVVALALLAAAKAFGNIAISPNTDVKLVWVVVLLLFGAPYPIFRTPVTVVAIGSIFVVAAVMFMTSDPHLTALTSAFVYAAGLAICFKMTAYQPYLMFWAALVVVFVFLLHTIPFPDGFVPQQSVAILIAKVKQNMETETLFAGLTVLVMISALVSRAMFPEDSQNSCKTC